MPPPDAAKTRFDLDSFVPYRLAVAARRVSLAFAATYREQFGLTVPQWRVLAHLTQADSVSVREIHERVDMDKSKVSRAAASLEKHGYVEKLINADDRRLVVLRLTPDGKALIQKLIPVAEAFQRDILALLGDDRNGFEKALDRIISANSKQAN